MTKEKRTDKLIKHFYGITGPLDEYKRREVERIGNICFIWLAGILIFGNTVAIFLGNKYPEFMALAYPIFLEIIILALFVYVILKSKTSRITRIDVEELSEKETKQLKHLGLRTGLFFGFFMWIIPPLLSDQNYLSELLDPVSIIGAILAGLFFGASMQAVAKARQK